MSDSNSFRPVRLCTTELPAGERVAVWREHYGRTVFRVDIEPHAGTEFACTLLSRALPDVQIVKARMSQVRVARTPELAADGDDKLTLVLNLSGAIATTGNGHEALLHAGDAVLTSGEDVCAFDRVAGGRSLGIRIPHAVLAGHVNALGDLIMRRIPREAGALRLLAAYAATLADEDGLEQGDIRSAVANHVQDLVALTLGASADAGERARRHGLPAARLAAAKAYVSRHSGRSISVHDVAGHVGVTKRTIQQLFEKDGTTFSAFLLSQRLARARRMLTDAKHVTKPISAVAYDVGFGDLSYFNRSFKRRYGAAPRELREISFANAEAVR